MSLSDKQWRCKACIHGFCWGSINSDDQIYCLIGPSLQILGQRFRGLSICLHTGLTFFYKLLSLWMWFTPTPQPLVTAVAAGVFHILGKVAFLASGLSLHGPTASKPWRCQTGLHCLQPSQRHAFLTERQEWPSLQPCYPCHSSLHGNISLQRPCSVLTKSPFMSHDFISKPLFQLSWGYVTSSGHWFVREIGV